MKQLDVCQYKPMFEKCCSVYVWATVRRRLDFQPGSEVWGPQTRRLSVSLLDALVEIV